MDSGGDVKELPKQGRSCLTLVEMPCVLCNFVVPTSDQSVLFKSELLGYLPTFYCFIRVPGISWGREKVVCGLYGKVFSKVYILSLTDFFWCLLKVKRKGLIKQGFPELSSLDIIYKELSYFHIV